RLKGEIAATSTFKQLKLDLAQQGFDPAAIKDPLYVRDPHSGTYEKLDAKLYADIKSGRMSL
ncbi:MAG: long-chain-acyl-CoA synthetase, partial [bacterium]